MFISKRILSLLVISLVISGCASQIQVRPDELIGPQVFSTIRAQSNSHKVAVADLSLKTGKAACEVGEAKTGGFNMPTPIRLNEPSNLLVTHAIKRGLSKMGHQVVPWEDADYKLDGAVETLWVEEYATGFSMEYAKAHVRYDVILRDRNGTVIWATAIESFKTSRRSMDATYDDIATLNAALDDSISQLFGNPSFRDALLR